MQKMARFPTGSTCNGRAWIPHVIMSLIRVETEISVDLDRSEILGETLEVEWQQDSSTRQLLHGNLGITPLLRLVVLSEANAAG
jgi:hypothetical protein